MHSNQQQQKQLQFNHSMTIEIGSCWVSKKANADWKLHDVDSGVKEFVHRIAFRNKFDVAPNVCVFLTSVDLGGDDGFRVNVHVKRVTGEFVEFAVQSWAEGIVWGVCCCYIAFDHSLPSKSNRRVQCGRVILFKSDAGFELNKSTKTMRTVTRRVLFPHAFECATPRIFLAFSSIDGKGDGDARFSTVFGRVSSAGFDLSVNAWDDGRLDGATITWFAFDESYEKLDSSPRLCVTTTKFSQDDVGFKLHTGDGARAILKPTTLFAATTTITPPSTKSTTRKSKASSVAASSSSSSTLETPHVGCALVGAATNARTADVRIGVSVADVKRENTQIALSTWSDTRIQSAMVMCLAMLPNRRDDANNDDNDDNNNNDGDAITKESSTRRSATTTTTPLTTSSVASTATSASTTSSIKPVIRNIDPHEQAALARAVELTTSPLTTATATTSTTTTSTTASSLSSAVSCAPPPPPPPPPPVTTSTTASTSTSTTSKSLLTVITIPARLTRSASKLDPSSTTSTTSTTTSTTISDVTIVATSATTPPALSKTRSMSMKRANDGDSSTSKKSKKDDEDKFICKICMETEVQCVFIPCGHQIACEPCAKKVKSTKKQCPICSAKIKSVVRTYLS